MRAGHVWVLGVVLLTSACDFTPGAMFGGDSGESDEADSSPPVISSPAQGCRRLQVSSWIGSPHCKELELEQLRIVAGAEDGTLRLIFHADELGAYPVLEDLQFAMPDISQTFFKLECSAPEQKGDDRESKCSVPAWVGASSFKPELGMVISRFSRFKLKHPVCDTTLTVSEHQTTCDLGMPVPEGFEPPWLFITRAPAPVPSP